MPTGAGRSANAIDKRLARTLRRLGGKKTIRTERDLRKAIRDANADYTAAASFPFTRLPNTPTRIRRAIAALRRST